MAKIVLCIIMVITTVMSAGHIPSENCPICGAELSVYEDYCISCGADLTSPATAAESENFTVDENMMSYFIATSIEPYSSYFYYLGIDSSVSLKDQGYSDGMSWYDYFAEYAKAYVGDLLILCEYAEEVGISLGEEDIEYVDTYVSSIAQLAANNGYTTDEYLATVFGDGVSADVLERCLELELLATAAYNAFNENAAYTAEELLAYREENSEYFLGVDLVAYTFESTEFTRYDENGNAISTTEEDVASARLAASELRKAATAEEFLDMVADHLEATFDKETADAYNAYYRHCTAEVLSEKAASWAFSAEVGDKLIETEDDCFSVYLLVKAPYIDEDVTRSSRHILLSYETYADYDTAYAVYEAWESAGFSDEKFIELEEIYSEDSESSGGRYDDVPRGYLLEEYEAWLFDAERQIGDHGFIETSYGWHIVEYLGEGECTSWEAIARDYIAADDYEAMISEGRDGITYYDDVIDGLNF